MWPTPHSNELVTTAEQSAKPTPSSPELTMSHEERKHKGRGMSREAWKSQQTAVHLPTTVAALGPVKVQLPRTQIRAAGFVEIMRTLRQRFPKAPRHVLRAWAKQLQKESWAVRDHAAVAKLVAGMMIGPEDDPNYWKNVNPHLTGIIPPLYG